MRTNGFEWARAWVTMTESSYLQSTPWSNWPTLPWRNEYWSSVEYAGRILAAAASLGFRLNAVLTLSNTSAHGGQQIPPPGWEAIGLEETCNRLTAYGAAIAQHFQERGLDIELYDIGNEIDSGVLGLRPGERITRPAGVDQTRNIGYMETAVWSTEAKLLQAAIAGVRQSDPDAKIVLHVDSLDVNMDLAGSFFEYMVREGVGLDYAGLSLPYPDTSWTLPNYSRDCWYQKVQDLVDRIALLGKKVIICECAYPSSPEGIGGQPMPDYPFTPEGQSDWVHDVLRFARNSPNIKGLFYFYPDWFPGMSQDASTRHVQSYGLFATNGIPKAAMQEFRVNLPPQ
jgi:arabinogalactan endo-1,4-beta-galactosidase